ncbi:hypothetical protein EDB92DRAFT_1818646 [Lactarius akahatsu]|uniref:Uncharacterized protein n=1 Tax=Lactarius akahatsu TaxID=416441 RepID=A0AAD4LEK1_9AGAM|nr:hypothetical protein EDB92DRAFT_1818646 [Lactarius akahatsu]
MTDWKSPVVVTADYFALIKFYHAIWGALIWEFVVNIEFEYAVFTGKRKFRSSFLECEMMNSSWYIQLYLASRWCPVFCVITILVGFDPVNRINCQLFGNISLVSASALIVLRIAAIWGLNKIAISIASAAWLASAGSLIHGVVVLHGTWSRDLPVGICNTTNTLETRANILVTFVTDLVLLALMLTGLLRWGNARQKGGIWWLLFTQGLAWMIIVTVAEVPITCISFARRDRVFTEEYFHRSHEPLITMTIGASRVYRGLSDYVHKEGDVHMSSGLPVRQTPIGSFSPRLGRGSLALGTSGKIEFRLCRIGKALDLRGDMCGCQSESTNNEALVLEA